MFTEKERQVIGALSPLPAVPADPTNRYADDSAAAHLGQYIFFDERFSLDGETSCATCHDPKKSWTDGQAVPAAFSDQLRHVPSLWNVAYNRWYFWDGRADSLWSQALHPLEQADEHGGSRAQYAKLVHDDPDLKQAYERIFGTLPEMSDASRFPAAAKPLATQPADPLNVAWGAMSEADRETVNGVFVNVGKALAAYQRRIISRASPFDTFVEGLKTRDERKQRAISDSAKRGLKFFIGRGNCILCHHGPNFTDNEFHNTGVAELLPLQRPDHGRFLGVHQVLNSPFNVLGSYSDDVEAGRRSPTAYLVNFVHTKRQFKTPSLRNVARTPPYMHRGQFETLEDVIKFYSTLENPQPKQTVPGLPQRPIPPAHRHGGGDGEHILLPLHLSKTETDDLVAFLESLTDESLDTTLMVQPDSPISR